jgi:hypothetical protein
MLTSIVRMTKVRVIAALAAYYYPFGALVA